MNTFHRNCKLKKGILTMGLFHASNPQSCGIAVLDNDNKIIEFTEKPPNPMGHLANSGIYIASKKLFDFFPRLGQNQTKNILDLGFHILPHLIGKMFGCEIREYLRDIGTIENYTAALA